MNSPCSSARFPEMSPKISSKTYHFLPKFSSCELNFFLYILPEMEGKSFETYHMTVRLQLIGKTENFACDGATLSNSVNQFTFAVINFCTFADGSQLCGWKISHLIQVIIFLCRFIFGTFFYLPKQENLSGAKTYKGLLQNWNFVIHLLNRPTSLHFQRF